MNNLLKRLDVDSWHFYTMNPRWYISVKHNDDDVMKAWNRRNPTDVRIHLPIPTRGQFNFKDEIENALLEIIRPSKLNLPLFLDKGVKSIKLIESLTTVELGKDLLDVYTELYQAFEDITKVAPLGDKLLPKNYSRSLTNLEQQAANEWFAERYIKKGMILETGATSEEILDIVNDEVITANRKYPELLQLNSQAAVNTLLDYDFIRRSTWRSYNPEINTVKLINPAQHIVDYELRFEKEHR